MRARSRFALDIALAVGLLAAYRPTWTGISLHQWLSIAIIAPLLAHLVVNWQWTLRVLRTFVHRLLSASRLNFAIDAALLVSTVAVMLSGFMVSPLLLSPLGIQPSNPLVWHELHLWSANATIALFAIHAAMHWRWFVATAQRLAASTDTPRRNHVAPVAETIASGRDRRGLPDPPQPCGVACGAGGCRAGGCAAGRLGARRHRCAGSGHLRRGRRGQPSAGIRGAVLGFATRTRGVDRPAGLSAHGVQGFALPRRVRAERRDLLRAQAYRRQKARDEGVREQRRAGSRDCDQRQERRFGEELGEEQAQGRRRGTQAGRTRSRIPRGGRRQGVQACRREEARHGVPAHGLHRFQLPRRTPRERGVLLPLTAERVGSSHLRRGSRIRYGVRENTSVEHAITLGITT